MSRKLKNLLNNSQIICLCEGTSEEGIMNMLINAGELIFSREQLVYKKVHRRISVKKVQRKFLNLEYDSTVVILRIIDSKREQFNLDKVYAENTKIKKATCLTKPEIEILIIIDSNELEKYYKVKSKMKPSEFCKQKLEMSKVKKSGFIEEYFEYDVQKLIEAIKIYNSKKAGSDFGLFNLLK